MNSFEDEDEEEMKIGFNITDWDLKNEFAIKGRRKRQNGKDFAIYGSFMANEDRDDDPQVPKSSSFQSKGGINFVKSRVQLDQTQQQNNEDLEKHVESNQSLDDSKRNRNFEPKLKEKNRKVSQQFAGMRRPANIGTDENFGHWESYTKGIGAKLLGKMGFEPGKGLGKNLQGIIAPIEAKKRPGFGAIGSYGPEHKQNPFDDELEDIDKTRRKLKAEKEWKKTEQNTKRAKKVIKSAEQIIAENLLKPWKESDVTNVKVIDMTGPEQRVLSGYHEINQIMNEDIIDGLSDITAQEIAENTKELKRESYRLSGLEEEIERLKEVIEEETNRCKTIEVIFNDIDSLSNKFNQNQLSIDEILVLYEKIRTENPLEFEYLKLHEILIPTAFPLIRNILSDWKALEENNSIKQLFVRLKQIIAVNDDSIYELILWEIWMPVVRHHIYGLPSIRQCDEVINFLDSWRNLLPDWLFDNIIEQLILPLLQKEVEDWNPLTDTVPIHSWLHPWLPLMADRSLEHLYDPIRHKLSNALTNWHPSDNSAKLILQPWKGVFSSGAMEAFLNINIVPKLELTLQSFIINPHQQCLDVWNWVMSWKDLLSTPIMASILEKNFFPKWLNVLYNWLSNEPNFNEVNKWYMGWKTMISTQLLSYPSIAEMLSRALQMMEHSVHSKGQMKPFHSYHGSVQSSHQTPTHSFNSMKEQTISENSLNFKELVEQKARERGILFMPIAHRFHQGKQVHKLGNLITHIDNKVLFVLRDNNWVPTSLQLAFDSAL